MPEDAKDENLNWEIRREWALKQLLHDVKKYVNATSEKQGLGKIPEWQKLYLQIIHVLFFDWSIQVSKPETVIDVINSFVQNAVGEKS